MDSRSLAFLEIMIALGVIGVVAFLIYLVAMLAQKKGWQTARGDGGGYRPQWYEFLLAAILVIVVIVLFLWQFPPGGRPDWATDNKAVTFFVIMMVLIAIGIIVFLITVFWQISQQPKPTPDDLELTSTSVGTKAANQEPSPVKARHETPSAVRLLGLLGFIVAFLILNWSYVAKPDQYFLMLNLIYPAGLVVGLVMLFDKANRAWHIKLPGESIREWLFCDAILFLYILGYLNLRQSATGETYNALFWDVLHIVGFLFIYWVIDRKTTRLRFFVGHLYIVALPILLLIWRTVQDVKIPEDIAWWSTIWPFFALAVVFLAIEFVILLVNRGSESQILGIVKDVLFFALYVVLLIAALPETAGA